MSIDTACEVHPRSRGEYCSVLPSALALLGSPPLTRGILDQDGSSQTTKGFTPAHAGNTANMYFTLFRFKVHPRSRGEYKLEKEIGEGNVGSPPLTRGILSYFTG